MLHFTRPAVHGLAAFGAPDAPRAAPSQVDCLDKEKLEAVFRAHKCAKPRQLKLHAPFWRLVFLARPKTGCATIAPRNRDGKLPTPGRFDACIHFAGLKAVSDEPAPRKRCVPPQAHPD